MPFFGNLLLILGVALLAVALLHPLDADLADVTVVAVRTLVVNLAARLLYIIRLEEKPV